jgi:hypothetical protein
MGWLAALFQDNCDFSRITGEIVSQLSETDDTPFLEVGFSAYREPIYDPSSGSWNVIYTGKCLEYPEGEDILHQDASWKTAKAFAFLARVLGGGGTFFLWFSTCCIFGRATWRLAGCEVLLAAVFQSLAFVWFTTAMCQDSENTCSLFWGSKSDILATCFWLLSAVLIFCYYPAPKELDENDGIMMDPRNNATRPAVSVNYEQQQLQLELPEEPAGSLSLTEPGFADFDGEGDEQEENMPMTTMSSGEDSRQEGNSDNNRDTKDMADVEII